MSIVVSHLSSNMLYHNLFEIRIKTVFLIYISSGRLIIFDLVVGINILCG
jgi:hypothetical protein